MKITKINYESMVFIHNVNEYEEEISECLFTAELIFKTKNYHYMFF